LRIGLWAAWRKRACCSSEETFAEQQCLSALYAPSVLAGLGSADPAALKRAAEWANRPATTAPLGRYGWQKQSSMTRPRPLRSRIWSVDGTLSNRRVSRFDELPRLQGGGRVTVR